VFELGLIGEPSGGRVWAVPVGSSQDVGSMMALVRAAFLQIPAGATMTPSAEIFIRDVRKANMLLLTRLLLMPLTLIREKGEAWILLSANIGTSEIKYF